MADTPELDRFLHAIEPQQVNDTLSAFYDWLEAEGYVIARYGKPKERQERCRACRGTGRDPSKLNARQRQLFQAGHMPDADFPKCKTCGGEGDIWVEYVDPESLAPAHVPPGRLFAAFLGVDEDKMEEERRAILAELQAAA